jgi:hypothetical protein
MIETVKQLLPIGTVVLLKEGNKRLMIYGIKQSVQSDPEKPGEEYDYIGVPYPEGNMGTDYQYLFNHDNIKEVYFRGFEDVERQEFIYNLERYYEKNSNQDDSVQ